MLEGGLKPPLSRATSRKDNAQEPGAKDGDRRAKDEDPRAEAQEPKEKRPQLKTKTPEAHEQQEQRAFPGIQESNYGFKFYKERDAQL